MERYDTLLISSCSAENRAHLRHVMGEGFNLLEAVNVKQTMLLLKQNSTCIAALLLDITHIYGPKFLMPMDLSYSKKKVFLIKLLPMHSAPTCLKWVEAKTL